MSLLSTAESLCTKAGFDLYRCALYGQPAFHQYRTPPRIVFYGENNRFSSIQTLIIPTFNHSNCIEICLTSALASITMPTDIIIIDDASADDTIHKVKEQLPVLLASDHIGRILLLSNENPVFETACDNMGFFISNTAYVVEIQADIAVKHASFDQNYISVMNSRLRPASISGRCGHGYGALVDEIFKKHDDDEQSFVGLTGNKISSADIDCWINNIYQCETVNRGPWMLRKEDLIATRYLDEGSFFLGFDDHDFHRRLWQITGRHPVYVPTRIASPPEYGAQRRARTGINKITYDLLKATRKPPKEFVDFVVERGYANLTKPYPRNIVDWAEK